MTVISTFEFSEACPSKKFETAGNIQTVVRGSLPSNFLAGQSYSLAGCSPAEPTSASLWLFKITSFKQFF